MTKKESTDQKKEATNIKEEKKFKITKEFLIAIRKYFGTKPFIHVAGPMSILVKEEMNESEVNSIINTLGSYPYDEVADLFGAIKTNIAEIKIDAENEEIK